MRRDIETMVGPEIARLLPIAIRPAVERFTSNSTVDGSSWVIDEWISSKDSKARTVDCELDQAASLESVFFNRNSAPRSISGANSIPAAAFATSRKPKEQELLSPLALRGPNRGGAYRLAMPNTPRLAHPWLTPTDGECCFPPDPLYRHPSASAKAASA